MKVLITSGGGAKGAFTVGALDYIKNTLGISRFDLISGTSTGSLIASLAAIGKIDTLKEIYLNTTNADVLAPENVMDSILSKHPYLFDTEPLLRQIDTHITDSVFNQILNSSTTLCLNSISLQSGKVTVFTTGNITPTSHYNVKKVNARTSFRNALLASSNQAVFMNPKDIGGEQFVDGGNREVVPTRVVCNTLSLNEQHEIYVLSNNPNEIFPVNKKLDNILDVLIRSISIFIQEVRENDLEVLSRFWNLCSPKPKIFYICPESDNDLDPEFPTGLRFDKSLMNQWMKKGKRIADEVIRNTPNGNFPF